MAGGSETTTGVSTRWDGCTFTPVAGVVSYRAPLVAVASASGGGSAVRADGQAVWIRPRSGSEWIGAGVRAIGIYARYLNGPSPAPRQVTDRSRVKWIVALVNALPAAQPGGYSCAWPTGDRM
jgi:hypothetical protein